MNIEDVRRDTKAASASIEPAGSDAATRLRTIDPFALKTEGIDLTSKAAAIYRARRCRSRSFGNAAALFAEPAWDILLDLYIARGKGYEVSIGDACVAAAVPISTGLRWVAKLEKNHLLHRSSDKDDNRRSIVRMTDLASEMMERWLLSV